MTTAVGTCNLACWMAREDVCRCMCGGENHGIMRHGEEQPGRYCQRRSVQYELDSMYLSYFEAYRATEEIRRSGFMYHTDLAFSQKATGHMLKWPEVESMLRFMMDCYLVWVRR